MKNKNYHTVGTVPKSNKRLKSKITQRYLGANKTKSLHRIVKIDKGFKYLSTRKDMPSCNKNNII
jgi:hypothetical protein